MSQRFEKFMVHARIGTNRKLRRLPPAQRWTYVAGVLALAAQSPLRGALLISDGLPVGPEDVAEEATVPVRVAVQTLESLRELGMLDRDEDGVEWVHDWDSLNPDPKPSDSPDATRARKRLQRDRERPAVNGHAPRHANVTRDIANCHAPEVEEEAEGKNYSIASGGMSHSAGARPPQGKMAILRGGKAA